MTNARTQQFDAYMATLERKGHSQQLVYGAMAATVGALGLAVAALGWFTFGVPAKPAPNLNHDMVIQVTAQAGERIPVYMMSGDVDGLRAARNASLARQNGYLNGEEEKHAGTTPDTVTFGSTLVKDVVADEVDSFLFRLELIGRVGEYVVNRANNK